MGGEIWVLPWFHKICAGSPSHFWAFCANPWGCEWGPGPISGLLGQARGVCRGFQVHFWIQVVCMGPRSIFQTFGSIQGEAAGGPTPIHGIQWAFWGEWNFYKLKGLTMGKHWHRLFLKPESCDLLVTLRILQHLTPSGTKRPPNPKIKPWHPSKSPNTRFGSRRVHWSSGTRTFRTMRMRTRMRTVYCNCPWGQGRGQINLSSWGQVVFMRTASHLAWWWFIEGC